MKKNTMRAALLMALMSAGFSVNAQNKELKVGNNPTIKEPSAVLEVESANKGMLMPRVTLTGTDDTATIPSPANALTVFNTATAGMAPNDVTPGYYYWSTADGKWMKLLTENDAVEPWQVQGTSDKATSNAQDIYQAGKVAIGTTSAEPTTAKQFEVNGDMLVRKVDAGILYGFETNNDDNTNTIAVIDEDLDPTVSGSGGFLTVGRTNS